MKSVAYQVQWKLANSTNEHWWDSGPLITSRQAAVATFNKRNSRKSKNTVWRVVKITKEVILP